jgi:hypothetical protein
LQQQLANILAPKQVRILPYPIVLLVLAAFVVVIGPLDWIVLGRLRMRDDVGDVSARGRVLHGAHRFSRGELHGPQKLPLGADDHRSRSRRTRPAGDALRDAFPARNQEVTTDVRNALCVPMSVSQNYYYGTRPGSAGPARYEGLFPAGYKVRQSLRQWTPQMNRLTSFDAGEDKSGMPWEKLDPQDLSVGNFRDRIGSNAEIELYIIRGGEIWVSKAARSMASHWRFASRAISGGPESLPSLGRTARRISRISRSFLSRLTRSVSVPGPPRSTTSASYTPEESDVNATIIVRREGENVHIYRHFTHHERSSRNSQFAAGRFRGESSGQLWSHAGRARAFVRIPRGEVFGFIGPNGAGKTSTIKVLATLLKPSAGRALVDGLDVDAASA